VEQPDHTEPTVYIWRDHHGRPQARCECGWYAPPRWFRGNAVTDALIHSAHTIHMPADPIDLWKAVAA
jgi:hypothetical protein